MKKYDGCSGGMSRWWRMIAGHLPPWEGCCDDHDQHYAVGGTKLQRWKCDIRLMYCVQDNGHPLIAKLMLLAVRIGGHPLLPLPWRWGFKHHWPHNYTQE